MTRIGARTPGCSIVPRVKRHAAFRLLLAAALMLPLPARAAVPTLPPDSLHAGQDAVVRTVFAGTRIETFDAEIVGVLDIGRTEGRMILARATRSASSSRASRRA